MDIVAHNPKNQLLVDEFVKLVEQVKYEIDNLGGNPFRLQKIKISLKTIVEFKDEIKSGNQLKNIEGIGKGTINRIDEILRHGFLSEINVPSKYKQYMKHMIELEKVFGIGRKLSYEFVSKHNITNIKELLNKHKTGEIKLTKQMLTSIKNTNKYVRNIPRVQMNEVDKILHKAIKGKDFIENLHVVLCGSFRRLKMSSNDVDVLVVHKKNRNSKVVLMEYIKDLKKIGFIIDDLVFDYNKTFMGYCTLDNGKTVMRIDIKIFPIESYYTALMYFTGSGEFNQKMRLLAKNLGFKLNEYGLFKLKRNERIDISSEKDIFDALGLDYVPPEER